MLVFDACLLWFILILIEHRSLRNRLSGFFCPFNVVRFLSQHGGRIRAYCWKVPQFGATSNDMTIEQTKSRNVVEQNRTSDYSLVVNGLTKIYPSNNFKAVDELSFVVDKQEFFGLLGVNGNYLF